ncbi:nucleotidyltransferase [Planctomycetales bacterium]|nr:nucleotidyltransferase [Planctomycetales bacterium]GHT38222.1 nucleotidyltransferase [Planctomycetales bacterium]
MIDTAFYQRCIETLETALAAYNEMPSTKIEYEVYRSACVKEFELIMEQSGKLLRKVLNPYLHSAAAVNRLPFKDLFRQAALRGLITEGECERWLTYRDNRNTTAHDNGVDFAVQTMELLPQFIIDAEHLKEIFDGKVSEDATA